MYGSELSSGLGQNMGFEGGAHLCKLTIPYDETSTATAVYVNNHSFFFLLPREPLVSIIIILWNEQKFPRFNQH